MENKRSYVEHLADFTRSASASKEKIARALLATAVVGGSAFLAYKAFFSENEAIMAGKTTIDLKNQSILLPGDERIRACPLGAELIKSHDENIKTVKDLFQASYDKFGQNDFLGWRVSDTSPYQWVNYQHVQEMAYAIGSGLINLGIKPKSLIGMCAANKPQWTMTEHGFAMFSMVAVPLYETLGKDGIRHIMGQTEMEVIFCDSRKVEKLLEHGGSLGYLKWIVVFDDIEESIANEVKASNIILIKFDDLVASGRSQPQKKVSPLPEDMSSICYTSGTTGNPKGVVLSHRAIVSSISAAICGMQDAGIIVGESDSVISYLPLSHAYERVVELSIAWIGGRIGYFRGDITKLLSDIQELKPTMFPTVPRLLNSLHDRIMLTVSESKIKSFLLRRGLTAKADLLKKGSYSRHTIWDKLVFRKIQDLLGGKVRIVLTGSAPLSASVLVFAKCALGCPVLEGYGQTESCGAASITNAFDFLSGHVGCPVKCFHIKVVDVPDLGYHAKDDCGEICLRGPALCSGYYKDPEKTRETIDEDGWLHTGDIGRWLPTGVLQIIDRKKHMFKLSQGEYVAPEKVELIYMKSQYVTHIFLTGDSLKNFVVAVVVPDKEVLLHWAKKNAVKEAFEELCKRQDVKALIFDSMMQVAIADKLCSFEQAKLIHLDSEEFSVDNDMLTPTFKKRRPQLKAKYKQIIEDMYTKQEKNPPKISVF